MAREPRKRPTIPKEMRRSLRLWAQGGREEVLTPFIPDYAAAMNRGSAAERRVLRHILVRFNTIFPWWMPDHEEPASLEYDPEATVPVEVLTADQQLQKNDCLARRIKVRVRSNASSSSARTFGRDPAKDPYARLVIKLSGYTPPQKARQAYQQFMAERYASDIAPIVDMRWSAAQAADVTLAGRRPRAGFRAAVARELFNALSEAERKAYGQRAAAKAKSDKAEYDEALKRAPSSSPEDRQAAINRLPDFVGPILQEIYNVTGCHATLILGGPHPEFGGQIATQHISFGRNLTGEGHHWAEWDPTRFEDEVLKFFIEYLKTAYSPDTCASSALPPAARRAAPAAAAIGEANDSDHDSSGDVDSSDSEDDWDATDDGPSNIRSRSAASSSGPGPATLAARAAASAAVLAAEAEDRDRAAVFARERDLALMQEDARLAAAASQNPRPAAPSRRAGKARATSADLEPENEPEPEPMPERPPSPPLPAYLREHDLIRFSPEPTQSSSEDWLDDITNQAYNWDSLRFWRGSQSSCRILHIPRPVSSRNILLAVDCVRVHVRRGQRFGYAKASFGRQRRLAALTKRPPAALLFCPRRLRHPPLATWHRCRLHGTARPPAASGDDLVGALDTGAKRRQSRAILPSARIFGTVGSRGKTIGDIPSDGAFSYGSAKRRHSRVIFPCAPSPCCTIFGTVGSSGKTIGDIPSDGAFSYGNAKRRHSRVILPCAPSTCCTIFGTVGSSGKTIGDIPSDGAFSYGNAKRRHSRHPPLRPPAPAAPSSGPSAQVARPLATFPPTGAFSYGNAKRRHSRVILPCAPSTCCTIFGIVDRSASPAGAAPPTRYPV
ncbi:hypothetical protein MKEN_01028800 [Mycena kentingensis (nom. inval.)]|nr:hypothetical protein MKEN_01028800 [Mycena kentingensis (nom. inval.)]